MKKWLLAMLGLLLIIVQLADCFAYDGIICENTEEIFDLKENVELEESLMNNRYIVKYRESENSQLRDLVHKLTNTGAEKDFNRTLANFAADTDLEYNVLNLEENVDVIEFNEKIPVDNFISKLNFKIDTDVIEYIQPDYLLDLASNDIELNIDVANIADAAENTEHDTNGTEKNDSTDSIEYTEDNNTENELMFDSNLGESINVAVIDSGVDISHDAFSSRIINAWDFVNDCKLTYNYANNGDYHHGTHIVGIIADNTPSAKIMPLKVFEDGKAYTSDIIKAIEFAESNGASIVNCSWGSTDNNPILKETIENSDMLFICAVGNNQVDLECTPIYPACFDLDNIVSVTSVNDDKGLSYFSNYNENFVDVAAPGRDIYSTFPDNRYGEMSGTSMSAAYVTAMAAIAETCRYGNVKSALLSTSDQMSNLCGKVAEGKCVNIDNLVNNIVNESIIQNNPVDDFDESGYEMTPSESWDLFCSLDNIQVSAGDNHSIALKNNGTVWTWGKNDYAQLGDGTTNNSSIPTQVGGISDVVQVSAGVCHSLVLKSDGSVYAWGDNSVGQLGNETVSRSAYPLKVVGLNNVVKILAGDYSSFAVKDDGTVYSWGSNANGQLGDGTKTLRRVPILISGINNVLSISNFNNYTAAVKSDGTVWEWGYNSYGFGNVDTTTSTVPLQLSCLSNILQVSVGRYHAVALKNDGTVWGWGYNGNYQIGNGTSETLTAPVCLTEISNVTQIQATSFGSIALKNDGTVWVWGNLNGAHVPTQVSGLSNIVFVSAGTSHCLAVKSDGVVFSWGYNSYGQLGKGFSNNRTYEPAQVLKITNATKVSAGSDHSCVITNDLHAKSWGNNRYGQLGTGIMGDSSIPYCIGSQVNDTQGNTYDYAHEIPDNGLFEGGIQISGDYDWYKFTATCTGEYTIYTESSIDTYGELYTPEGAADGTMLAYNDDVGNGLNFSLTANLTAGNAYYLKVRRFASGTGAYILHVVKPEAVLKFAEFQLTCVPEQEFVLNFLASNVTSFNNRVFEVTYDKSKVLLTDATLLEYGKRLSPGKSGSVEILSVLPGRVLFKVDMNINRMMLKYHIGSMMPLYFCAAMEKQKVNLWTCRLKKSRNIWQAVLRRRKSVLRISSDAGAY